MSTTESITSFGDSGSTGGSATEASFILRGSPGSISPLQQGQGRPRRLPHCRECRRPMKGHHKYADCPRVKAQARRQRAQARFYGKLKKLGAKVDVVKGSREEINNLAQEAEDLQYKLCVVKGSKSSGNQGDAWLVVGEDGRAVQNVGSALRKASKAGRWGGPGARLAWKLFSSKAVQDVVRTWLLGWFTDGKERVGYEQGKN